jgi:N-formylglutamate amidohydrolase
LFFTPYHQAIQDILDNLRARHGKVLLWDCHSIRQYVPTIHSEIFPDLILGDVDGTSASPGLIETVMSVLDHSTYSVRHNHPFKGGYITRHFGRPMEHQHALQLEMTKVNYMDDGETKYDPTRADSIREVLKLNFEKLIEQLQ